MLDASDEDLADDHVVDGLGEQFAATFTQVLVEDITADGQWLCSNLADRLADAGVVLVPRWHFWCG